jgi:hypothetical protein
MTRRHGILAGYRGHLDTVEPALSGWVSEIDGPKHELALPLSDGRRLNLPGAPASVALGPVRADLISAAAASLDGVADLLRRNDSEGGFDPNLIGIEQATAFKGARRDLDADAAAGLREVWLSLRPDNTPALRLYEKLGFIGNPSHPPGRWAVSGEITMMWLPCGEAER